MNKREYSQIPTIVINILTKEVKEIDNYDNLSDYIGIPKPKISKYTGFWRNTKESKKAYKGWIIINKKDYIPSFNYISFKKERKIRTDYSKKSKPKKDKVIIPYTERNLKRIPILAIKIDTKEELYFPTIKSTKDQFLTKKVYKCINSPFGKYKHRGYFFKKI